MARVIEERVTTPNSTVVSDGSGPAMLIVVALLVAVGIVVAVLFANGTFTGDSSPGNGVKIENNQNDPAPEAPAPEAPAPEPAAS